MMFGTNGSLYCDGRVIATDWIWPEPSILYDFERWFTWQLLKCRRGSSSREYRGPSPLTAAYHNYSSAQRDYEHFVDVLLNPRGGLIGVALRDSVPVQSDDQIEWLADLPRR